MNISCASYSVTAGTSTGWEIRRKSVGNNPLSEGRAWADHFVDGLAAHNRFGRVVWLGIAPCQNAA